MKELALFLGLVVGAAGGDQSAVSGPTSGVIFDQAAGALRPVLGIPGAATLGQGMALGYPVTWIAVAPRVDSAVAAGQDGSVHFLRLAAGGISEREVAGVAGVPRQVVFSPSGTAAALVGPIEAQIVTGLPDAPVLTGNVVRLESAHSERRAAARTGGPSLALSDDGMVLLAAAGGNVRVAGADGRRVASGVMVAFAPGGHDAAIADGAGVSLVRDVTGAAQASVLAADGVARPVGLAFSADGKTVFAAASGGLVALPAAGGPAAKVSCACQPAKLEAMGSLFRLNDLGKGPLWLLDPTGQAPRTVFVPALQ